MSDPRLSREDQRFAQLRAGIADVDAHVARLSAPSDGGGAPPSELSAFSDSWKRLVVLLAVPAEPDRRSCPFCGGPIMRLATRCVHCWQRSSPE